MQLAEHQIAGRINANQFAAKVYDFNEVNQNVELELRSALKENRKLMKAGEMIKDAYILE